VNYAVKKRKITCNRPEGQAITGFYGDFARFVSCTSGQIAHNWRDRYSSFDSNDVNGIQPMEIDTVYRRILFTLVVISFVMIAPAHAVSLYKWVDEDGRVHYSQTPPEKTATQTEQMQVKDSNPYSQKETDNASNEEKPATDDQTVQVVETRKRNCEIAQKNLETYKSSERVQQPDGSIITLSDEMRASKIKEMQAQINAYCN